MAATELANCSQLANLQLANLQLARYQVARHQLKKIQSARNGAC